jgi:hypothetical protein
MDPDPEGPKTAKKPLFFSFKVPWAIGGKYFLPQSEYYL